MKKISSVWTLVYKEKDMKPFAFSYKSEEDAKLAKSMVEDSEGQEVINDHGKSEGIISYEWIYLIDGHFIEPNDNV